MDKSIYKTFILILFLGSSCAENTDINNVFAFNKFLGKEKSEVLDEAVISFEKYLELNYKNENNNKKRIKLFLNEYVLKSEPDTTKLFTTKTNRVIVEKFEKSGLRKEIWLYHNEEKNYKPNYNIYEFFPYQEFETEDSIATVNLIDLNNIEEDIIEIDSVEYIKREKELVERMTNSLSRNTFGDFLFGLTKFTSEDSFVHRYTKSRVLGGNFSPHFIIPGLLKQDINLNDPFIKRIITVDFYYDMMKWDIEQNE